MKLRNQAIINTSGNIIYLISLWWLTVITTRVLGYESAGTLILAMSIGNVVAVLQMYAVRVYQSSDMLFKFSSKDYLRSRYVTISFGWAVASSLCWAMDYSSETCLAIVLFSLIKTSESFSDVLFGNVQRLGHLEFNGYSMLFRGGLLVGLFSIGVDLYKSMSVALIMSAVGVLSLSLFVDLPIHNQMIRKEGIKQDNGVQAVLRRCFPLLLSALIPSVVVALPRLAIEQYCGPKELGFYGNVSTPALMLTTVVPTILIALLPRYGNAYRKNDYKHIKIMWIQSILGIFLCTIVSIAGVAAIGKSVLSFAYTDEIEPYVHYLYPIIVAMSLYVVTVSNCLVLISLRRNWSTTLTELSGLVLCLLLTIPLVKNYHIFGAVAVLALTYSVQVVLQISLIIKFCKK